MLRLRRSAMQAAGLAIIVIRCLYGASREWNEPTNKEKLQNVSNLVTKPWVVGDATCGFQIVMNYGCCLVGQIRFDADRPGVQMGMIGPTKSLPWWSL